MIILSIGCADDSYQYGLQPIVLIVDIDYVYGCIGTALLGVFMSNRYCLIVFIFLGEFPVLSHTGGVETKVRDIFNFLQVQV